MIKYKQQYLDMVAAHADLFTAFQKIHASYIEDPQKWKQTFNEEGQKVLLIIQKFDNNLCAKSEGGKYGKFSENLSNKFWGEVRIHFPKIDYVGMK